MQVNLASWSGKGPGEGCEERWVGIEEEKKEWKAKKRQEPTFRFVSLDSMLHAIIPVQQLQNSSLKDPASGNNHRWLEAQAATELPSSLWSCLQAHPQPGN